ncbi:MAG: acetylglutamate kinase [Planctomycetota bacterium]
MRILVKIGGAWLEETGPRAQLCQGIAAARRAGHEVVVVHGGGNQIRQLGRDLGVPERYHDGLRVTDARTAEVVLMVLAGQVNRTLTAALQRAGVPAAGICGADGGSFSARRMHSDDVDLGYVGAVDEVRPQLVRTLLDAEFVPVVATVAPGVHGDASEPFYNINADHAAAPLCKAFDCAALLFLTDVDGVRGDDGAVLPRLDPAACKRLIASGTASGGMLPKLDAALRALRENPTALVKIAPAGAADAVLNALRPDVGTAFVADLAATPHPAEAARG